MKPEYKIENWAIVDKRGFFQPPDAKGTLFLMGNIKDHPNCTNGKLQLTSLIVKINDDTIETLNSIYRLGRSFAGYRKRLN
jgi:hypothetical protein